MAIFGAPLEDPAAARHAATRCGRSWLRLASVVSHGPWPLGVGIGLHVGSAVTGNVGSPRHNKFTAIGDAVNLASRLEQLTKKYPTRLIVSDSMVTALGAAAGAATSLGAVTVNGHTEPMCIWAR